MMADKAVRRERTPRAIIACEPCRQFKTKCNQEHPCSYCTANKLNCVYRSERFVRERSVERSGKRRRVIASSATNTSGVASNPQNTYTKIASRSELHHAGVSVPPEDVPDLLVNQIVARVDDRSDHPAPSDSREADVIVPDADQDHIAQDDSDSGTEGNRFGDVLTSDRGPEFFGPSALLSFVKRLRRSAERVRATTQPGNHEISPGGNLMMPIHDQDVEGSEDRVDDHIYGSDLGALPATRQSRKTVEAFLAVRRAKHNGIDLEKECMRQFFSNLHVVYPFLDWTTFSAQSQRLFAREPSSNPNSSASFLALYCIVLALGAVTASSETSPDFRQENIVQYIQNDAMTLDFIDGPSAKVVQTSLSLGWWFFKLARHFLGDEFAKVTLERVQTLFLMSLFTKHALRPHLAYMYSSMALRGAFAIGMGNQPDVSKTSVINIRLFWVMYYHELDVCCSLGRETMLREPQYYPVYLAPWGAAVPTQLKGYEEEAVKYSRAMTELAQILRRISEGIYHPRVNSDDEDTVLAAMQLDTDLDRLQNDVTAVFNLNGVSLLESETTTKRKVLLKLRFYRARILLHRRTLLTSTSRKGISHYDESARICIRAAEQTISLLYDTYVHRPYFRSWWDNTVHAFDASCILLFATMSRTQSWDLTRLHEVIRKGCQIFEAMQTVVVAQRCAEFTRDLLYIAETAFYQGSVEAVERADLQTGTEERAREEASVPFPVSEFQSFPNQSIWNDDLLAALTASEPMDVLEFGFDTFFDIEDAISSGNI